MEKRQRNVRVADDLWDPVMAKCERLAHPDVSASAVCVTALEDFLAETDEASRARLVKAAEARAARAAA